MWIKCQPFLNQGTASWRELVQDTVGDDEALQLAMIRMLINDKDASEALYWAKRFNIPRKNWPWSISYEEELNECEGNIIVVL